MGMALFHHLLGEAGKDIIGSASTLVVKSLAPSVLVQELRAIIDHTTPHHTTHIKLLLYIVKRILGVL